MSDRHRDTGRTAAEKDKKRFGSLEVVVAAGMLVNAKGAFKTPRRTMRELRTASKGQFHDPFNLPAHHQRIRLEVWISKGRKDASLSDAVNEKKLNVLHRTRKIRVKDTSYPVYAFEKLEPGNYCVHIETRGTHQCLPDVRQFIYVGVRQTRRVVLVMAMDSIGDVAHSKGIFVGANMGWQRKVGTKSAEKRPSRKVDFGNGKLVDLGGYIENVPPNERSKPPKDPNQPRWLWGILDKGKYVHLVDVERLEKDSYRREFNAQTDYTNAYHPWEMLETGQLGPNQNKLSWTPPLFDHQPPRMPYALVGTAVLWNTAHRPNIEKSMLNHGPKLDIRNYVEAAVSSFTEPAFGYNHASYGRHIVVVNEPLPDTIIEPEYVVAAFKAAHEAASMVPTISGSTTLLLNEKRAVNERNSPKDKHRRTRYRRLIEKVLRAVPALMGSSNVTFAIGIQAHFFRKGICGQGTSVAARKKLVETYSRGLHRNLGRLSRPLAGKKHIPIVFTEMGVAYERIGTASLKLTGSKRIEQKQIYYKLLSVYLGFQRNRKIIFWGIDDAVTRNKKSDHLGYLFDAWGCKRNVFWYADPVEIPNGMVQVRPIGRKPAYFGVLQALIEAAPRV